MTIAVSVILVDMLVFGVKFSILLGLMGFGLIENPRLPDSQPHFYVYSM